MAEGPGKAAKSVPSSVSHLGAKTNANREAFDDNEARSHFSCIAQACDGSSRRKLRLYAAAQSGFLKTACARRRRRQSVLAELQPDRPHRDDAEQRRRISS